MTAPDPAARHDLENALADIDGLWRLLLKMTDDSDEGWLIYLASRLHDHERQAHDAFKRIYRLDEYHEPAALAQRVVPE